MNVNYDKKKGRYNGFSCWIYKNYGKDRCTSHAIGWKTLNQLVPKVIRLNAEAAKLATGKLVAAKAEKRQSEIQRGKRDLKKVDKRITELTKILTKLYEDLALEKISEKRYQTMAPSYEWEQAALKAQREDLAAEIAQGEEIYDYIEPFLPIIWKYTNITELNAHIIITLRTVSGRVFESHYPLQKSSVQIF